MKALRVLRPSGGPHIADIGRASNMLMLLALLPVTVLDGAERVRDNVAGRLPEFMHEVGFVDVAEAEPFRTVFGPVCLYRASKPSG